MPTEQEASPQARPLTVEFLQKLTEETAVDDTCVRREQPREQLYNEHVDIQLFCGNAKPMIVSARTRDISVSGMGVTSREEIGADEIVGVSFYLDNVLYGAQARVVHSSATVGGYKIGLQFIF